jgi:hypothetical protein
VTVSSPVKTDLDAKALETMIRTPGVYTVTITPQIAALMLERNVDNRNPKKLAIESFRREMAAHRWRLTNQGIGFDTDDRLADGQNRLLACIAADTPFTTLVVTGLDPDARDVIDTGVKRTFADVLRMHGIVNTLQLSGGVSVRFRYEGLVREKRPYHQASSPHLRGTHDELLEFLAAHPSLQQRISEAGRVTSTFHSLPSSAAIAFESMAVEANPQALEEFRDALVTGANLQVGDPRLALRNYLIRANPVNRGGPTSIHFLGLMVKIWNDWRNGLVRDLVVLKDTETVQALGAEPTWAARKARSKKN